MDEMAVLIRYGEVALKGGNRHHFERILMRRIKEKVSDLMDPDIKSKGGLLIMDITKEINDLNETKKIPNMNYLNVNSNLRAKQRNFPNGR